VSSSPSSPCHSTLVTCLDQGFLAFVSAFGSPRFWLESEILPLVWEYEEGRSMTLMENRNSL
jgi:hypothetical protein